MHYRSFWMLTLSLCFRWNTCKWLHNLLLPSLTGESVPITKTSLPTDNTEYSSVTHRRHTLFAGTEVIQSRYYSNAPVLAVVVRTGFLTAKGGMVRSILFPKPLNMKFYWDSIKFILILSCLAVVAFIYTFLVLQLRSHPVRHLPILEEPLVVQDISAIAYCLTSY